MLTLIKTLRKNSLSLWTEGTGILHGRVNHGDKRVHSYNAVKDPPLNVPMLVCHRGFVQSPPCGH